MLKAGVLLQNTTQAYKPNGTGYLKGLGGVLACTIGTC